MTQFVLFPGGGLHGDPASEGLCGSGSGNWAKSWEPSRESGTEHGDGPSGHYAVWTSGTQTCTLNTSLDNGQMHSKALIFYSPI